MFSLLSRFLPSSNIAFRNDGMYLASAFCSASPSWRTSWSSSLLTTILRENESFSSTNERFRARNSALSSSSSRAAAGTEPLHPMIYVGDGQDAKTREIPWPTSRQKDVKKEEARQLH